MTTWGRGSLEDVASTLVLALTGLGIGLALAPVNDAALAEASAESHGTASALVVVARMVGMVVGVALLTAIGLHQYYAEVGGLVDPTDTEALRDAAVLQVALGLPRGRRSPPRSAPSPRSPWAPPARLTRVERAQGCPSDRFRTRDDGGGGTGR